MIDVAPFLTVSRERAQVCLTRAINDHGGVYPERILLGERDLKSLRRNMDLRHGYHGKPLDILRIPVEAGDIADGMIGFEWSE